MAFDAAKSENRTEPHFWSWLLTKPITLGLAGLVILLTVFYVEEDLRGKLAWQQYRRQLQANGKTLDWNAFVPALVPEGDNVFRAPKMKDWFVCGGLNDFGSRRALYPLSKYLKERDSGRIAQITVVPIETNTLSHTTNGDIVLRYDSSFVSLLRNERSETGHAEPRPVLPLIVMQDAPLADAIRNLANQAGIKYTFAPKVAKEYVSNGQSQPRVTLRWGNITARHALISLLGNYGLLLIENPKTGIALIDINDPSRSPKVYVDTDASEEIKKLICQTITTNEVRYANGAQGIKLLAKAPTITPIHIVLQANQIPLSGEIKQLFPADILRGLPSAGNQLSVDLDGTNCFTLSFAADRVAAAEYLDWNNRFLSDFDHIREALKRPGARMDGDYSQPFSQPRLDYVSIRVISQIVAQRAQCYMLLDEPQKALEELTLLHEMNRLMEAKPVTLVAAMIETAITGMYTDMIAEGFRLGVWREPQLVALQSQLGQVSLPPLLRSAFLAERAGICRILDTQNAAKIQQSFSASQSFWQRMKDPKMLLATVAPRGWNQQNMVVVAMLNQKYVDGFDADRQIFSPKQLDSVAHDMQKTFSRVTPINFLAATCVPNFSRACQTVAWRQTMVNEAAVACALERYRSAHGSFPESLGLLVPDFIQKLPSDLIGGQPLHYRRKAPENLLLYSVGWNETDDGGVSIRSDNGYVDPDKGDWPWNPLQEKR